MDDLYDINFQSNDEFYKIQIRYNNVIHNWSIMDHLKNLSILEFSPIALSPIRIILTQQIIQEETLQNSAS
jgi:hypothetical protein